MLTPLEEIQTLLNGLPSQKLEEAVDYLRQLQSRANSIRLNLIFQGGCHLFSMLPVQINLI